MKMKPQDLDKPTITKVDLSKPLKTERTKISAAVPTATPINEINEIICTKLLFLLVEKNRFAIKNGKFICLFFQ